MVGKDIILYERVISREPDSIRELFLKFQPRMYCFAFRLVHDEADAKDIVQDSFISFWEHCDTIQSPSAIPAYLFTTLRHMCLKHVRRQSLSTSMDEMDALTLMEMEIAYFGESRNILDDLYFEELNSRYYDAIGKLPQQSRRIFMMSREEGLPYKEISRRLNLSVRTVENEIFRGMKLLRRVMKEASTAVVLFVLNQMMDLWI